MFSRVLSLYIFQLYIYKNNIKKYIKNCFLVLKFCYNFFFIFFLFFLFFFIFLFLFIFFIFFYFFLFLHEVNFSQSQTKNLSQSQTRKGVEENPAGEAPAGGEGGVPPLNSQSLNKISEGS